MLIIHAEIHTMNPDNDIIHDGYLLTENGKIAAIGSMSDMPAVSDTTVVDAESCHAYPGWIDAHTHLGLYGDAVGFESADGNEDSDPVMPQLRAIDGVNPLDRYFAEARKAGITTVITSPGSADPIAGQLAAIKTVGKRIDDMIIKAPVGIKFALGENPKSTFSDKDQSPVTRMATAALIREMLQKARKYQHEEEPEYDIKCEALLPLLEKKIPAHFHAHRADDIFTALRICREFDLDCVLVHATDAFLLCDELTQDNILGILSGPILTDRSKPELQNLSPASTGILVRNGFKTAVITDHPETPVQYLLLCAAVAVKEGLDREEALRAITCVPAEICGIADRVGSLEVGKDADILLYDGDPLNLMNSPKAVFINAQCIMHNYVR